MKHVHDLISVIVPIYKVEQFLEQCIQSIVFQTHKNLEIILVDDGSPDNCGKLCDEWASKDDRIHVIHKSNGGLSDARNAGIEVATGDYIAFVDSDDWIAPDMYEKMLVEINKEKADICACGIMACYSDHQICLPVKNFVGDSEKTLLMLYNDTAYPVSAWNKLYRSECWKNMRFPVGKICEDAFTTYLQIDRAERIVQISDTLYYYRIRENSIMTAEFRKARMDEEEAWRYNYEYMRKHYPKVASAAFDFYLQKVNILVHAIEPDQMDEFNNEHQFLCEILRKNIFYILFRSKLKLKQRIKLLIDYMKL